MLFPTSLFFMPNKIDPTKAKQIVQALLKTGQPDRDTRVAQFQRFESFILDGEQWDNMDLPALGDPQVTVNESEDYINTYLTKLFPRNPESGVLEVGARVRGKNREKWETEILDTYKRENLSAVLLEQGQDFFVGGDACIYYPQDPTTKKARIFSIDPTTVYMNWSGSDLLEFAFVDTVSDQDLSSSSPSFLSKAIRLVLGFTQSSPTDRITYWSNKYQIIIIGDTVEVRENLQGFIPMSWIPNKPKSHTHEGRSEAKGLYDLEQYNNGVLSGIAKRVQDNTLAPLALSTSRDTKDLQRDIKERSILPLELGGKAEFLNLPESPELLKFTEYISSKMDKKMAINEAVNGAVKSNVSSLAMMYYFSPLLDRIALKRVYWDQFFRDLNRAIIKYAGGTDIDCDTDPMYQPTMMLDQTQKIQNITTMLDYRLITYREAIDILRPFENSEAKMKEVEDEFARLSAISGYLPQKQSLNNQTKTQTTPL